MAQNIAVVGAGMSGLIASAAVLRVLNDTDARITLFDPGTPGGSFAEGGFKYLHDTQPMRDLLAHLSIPFETSAIRGGIMLDGKVWPYPEHLLTLPRSQMFYIMKAHYDKTRRDSHFTESSMNDPEGSHHTCKLMLDVKELVDALLAPVHKFIHSGVKEITEHEVKTDFESFGYDTLIYTLPLWVLKKIAPKLSIPDFTCERTKVSILKCLSTSTRFASFDYVYTPYTPGNVIHRVSTSGTWFDVETTSELTNLSLLFKDLAAVLGPSAHIWGGVTLDGHVKHLAIRDELMKALPSNWIMASRFACWDSRMTVDKVYEKVLNDLSSMR